MGGKEFWDRNKRLQSALEPHSPLGSGGRAWRPPRRYPPLGWPSRWGMERGQGQFNNTMPSSEPARSFIHSSLWLTLRYVWDRPWEELNTVLATGTECFHDDCRLNSKRWGYCRKPHHGAGDTGTPVLALAPMAYAALSCQRDPVKTPSCAPRMSLLCSEASLDTLALSEKESVIPVATRPHRIKSQFLFGLISCSSPSRPHRPPLNSLNLPSMIWSQVLGLLSLSLEWPSPDDHMPPLPYFPRVYSRTSSSQGALPGHCV